ncbi:hypothetical protein TNCV_4334351 [Trichonephila clavipes]|nr:hypothetical protein TNCV_4334351 [Trichonephila clavipes]
MKKLVIMALYRSPLTVTLWPSSFLKKYRPMIPQAHTAHQTNIYYIYSSTVVSNAELQLPFVNSRDVPLKNLRTNLTYTVPLACFGKMIENSIQISISKAVTGTCSEMKCLHGATCQERDDLAQCTCHIYCVPPENKDTVCGTDGNTYGSECQLRQFSCRYQKPISVASEGPCKRGGQFEYRNIKIRASRIVHGCRSDTHAGTSIFRRNFRMDELEAAIGDSCLNKSPDPDGIYDQMIDHLSLSGRQRFLDIINCS